MRKTKLLTVIITALAAVSMYGCANVDGEVSTTSSNIISQQTSEMISSLMDSPSDVSLPSSETSTTVEGSNAFPTKCKIYKQTLNLFTEEQLLSLFSGTPEKVDTGEGRVEYRTAIEEGFVDDEGYLHFATIAGNKVSTICEVNFLKENIIEGYEDEELDFATRAEIFEQVKILMRDKLGLVPEDLYVKEFYVVKKETVDLYKESIYQEANKPVTSDNEYGHKKLNEEAETFKKISSDDYYFISLGTKIDNIPTYPGGIFYYAPNNSNAIIGSMSEIVITKNGIEYAVVNNMREMDKASIEEADIISPDEAKALMRKKIDSVIWDGKIEIYDMKLVYLPIPQNDLGEVFTNFDTRPFYAFYHSMPKKANGSLILSDVITYFEAVTGAELVTE